MKISYNWLRQYINIDLSAPEAADLLTNCGLEVEAMEKFETVKGGLEGCVIGEVITKEKHPDADKLSLTTVNIGTGAVLHIVCGAPNVAAGQKVVVATAGSTIYPVHGEPVTLKKTKIRGAVSEGMICAEDELGLGTSHTGIMVLDPSAKTGTPAKEYFKIESDFIFEIGLTPNRADAASHTGVARDLCAVLSLKTGACNFQLPPVNNFEIDNNKNGIEIIVEDFIACPRYSGITISNIKVQESPAWLKNRLLSIGLRPINNVVDITNFVLHESGQPLHAFDAGKIKGKKVIVKKLPAKTKFKTLDGIERELTADDLMICDAEKGMCIAGVFGGLESGVTEQTKAVFLESAYFDPVHIRKTSKHHGLKTDASFRFERGTDPELTVYVLKRAALLIREIAGGEISSELIDRYSRPIEHFRVPLSYAACDKLCGKQIEREKIKSILISLGIEIISEGHDALLLSVPPRKVDVQREADVIEEILRIYGYNNIALPSAVRTSLSFSSKLNSLQIQNSVSELLSGNGFYEIFTNSLTRSSYYEKNTEYLVPVLNPLSNELNVLRKSMLFTGLEAIIYNINRKKPDLKFYEFGKTYLKAGERYAEEKHLALFVTGRQEAENWNVQNKPADFYTLKSYVNSVLSRLGIKNISSATFAGDELSGGLQLSSGKIGFAVFGKVKKHILQQFDIRQDVYYADFHWDSIIGLVKNNKTEFREISKFPEVRRDLALVVDKNILYSQLEKLAYETEKKLLKEVGLFDVYEGDKIGKGKKSYAISFTLQDEKATLTDKQIDKVMEKLQKIFEEKAGAAIRS